MSAKNLLKSFLVVLAVSSCKTHAPPEIESCVHNEDATAECYDPRLENDRRSYQNQKLENYICTNPNDYERMYNYAVDLRSKLIQCERDLNNN